MNARHAAVQIVCTIGPASRDPETLARLIEAGMGVARINFAHGTSEQHRETVARIRAAAQRVGRPIGVLQDLAGPKVRLGELDPDPVALAADDHVTLHCGKLKGSAPDLPVPDAFFHEEVRHGGPVLIGDGAVELEVIEIDGHEVSCRVVVGGEVSSRKGVNAPGGLSQRPLLDAKDEADLALGVELGVDWVGVSYVRSADDLRLVRRLHGELGADIPLVAKIETERALSNLDEILANTNAVMIARGDLSLEIPYERVPIEQKRIVRAAIRAGRPVITATQMLQSMTHAPRPSRAEITDVANAVLDGTDAVMLSDETAAGVHPVRACRAMARIVETTLGEFSDFPETSPDGVDDELRDLALFARAAVRTARDAGAVAILTWAQGGLAARMLSRQRPGVPILVPTSHAETVPRLGLSFGVSCVLCPDGRMTREQLVEAIGEFEEEALLLMVGHIAGRQRRIPWMGLVRAADTGDWDQDPRGNRLRENTTA